MQTLNLKEVSDRLDGGNIPITIADATLPDMPLIYANRAFYTATGYTQAEALHRNCLFLQADLDNTDSRDIIRDGLDRGKSAQAIFRNRRKDGTPFDQLLMIEPLHDRDGQLVYVVGSQFVITRQTRPQVAGDHALQVVKEIDRLLELNERLRASTRQSLARSTAASVRLWLEA